MRKFDAKLSALLKQRYCKKDFQAAKNEETCLYRKGEFTRFSSHDDPNLGVALPIDCGYVIISIDIINIEQICPMAINSITYSLKRLLFVKLWDRKSPDYLKMRFN